MISVLPPLLIAANGTICPERKMNLLTVPAQAIANPIAELTHSMQSLNTSVPFKCKVRLNLWDVEERKSSHPSARCRKGAGSATMKNRKARGHFRHAKSLKTRLGREIIIERDRGSGYRAEERPPSSMEECRC